MKKWMVVVAAVCCLAGCATVGRKIDSSALDQLKKGMTKQEVVSLLGSPDQTTRQGSGESSFHYSYVRSQTKAATFVPVVGMFAGGVDMQNQIVLVQFDTAGKVKDFTVSGGSTDMASGAAAGAKPDTSETEPGKRAKW